MKILHVADNLVMGGRERRLLELIKGLLSAQHEIVLVLFRDAIHYKEVHDLPIKLIVLKKRFRFDVFTYFQLFKICKETNPDVIHSWGGVPSVLAGLSSLWCKKKLVNGMIANSECKPFTMDWNRSKLSFPLSDVIVSNSNVGIKAYGVSDKKGVVISNGFDIQRLNVVYNRKETLKEINISNGQALIGMVASINWRKDYPTFIKSALLVLKQTTNVCFIIIGDGEDKEDVKEMIPEKQKRHFRFLGKRQDVDRFISVFDVGILASFGEGISNSIMEYMAFEKPVIASDVEGNRELVEADNSGFLVEVRNEQAMAEKILELLSDKTRSIQMGVNGKQIILERFTEKQMTEKYIKLYHQLLNNEKMEV
ncbi:glycosyltransferase [Carboxylicivirga sp. A043]|uniref:glycosyltransferase n=1 Tax=Carboxylicivirga litoralis TaxID=2816963 RepID=UPI0021CAE603|nr:glycosyltransferase [Carboxylicivirga sp. A043]MCU4155368.1 glycosyltransferase [Carboxylicivirga sp. A043]